MSPLPSSSRRRSIGSERAGWDGSSVPAGRVATRHDPRRTVGPTTRARRPGSIGPCPPIAASGSSPRAATARASTRRSAASARRRSATAWRSSGSATASAGSRRTAGSSSTSGTLAGILTVGGTILGTSRDKPHRMLVDGEVRDMTDAIVETYRSGRARRARLHRRRRDGQERAPRCRRPGSTSSRCPRRSTTTSPTTDATIGFATALEIATDAIDRLHSTAHSHHRIIVAELMGHGAGWLALGAGPRGRRRRDPDPRDPVHGRGDRRGDQATARRRARTSASSPSRRARAAIEDARALAALAEGRADRAKDRGGEARPRRPRSSCSSASTPATRSGWPTSSSS